MLSLGIGIGVQGNNKFDELISTGCRNWLIITGDDDYWIPRLKLLRQYDTIILRYWVQPIIHRDPIQIGRDAANAWHKWGDDPNIVVQIGNEYNLWYEYSGAESDQALFDDPASGGEGYKQVNAWCVRCFTEFRKQAPAAKLIWGTFSPGHNEDGPDTDWNGNNICQPARSLCDIDAAHAYKDFDYWDSGFRFARPKGYKNSNDPGGHYWLTDKPFWITEFNTGFQWTDTQWLDTYFLGLKTYTRVEKAFVFIGNYTDEGHRAFAISEHPNIMDWFKNYISNTHEEIPMPELTLTEKILVANGDTVVGDEIPFGAGVMRTGAKGIALAVNVGEWRGVYLPYSFPKVTITPA